MTKNGLRGSPNGKAGWGWGNVFHKSGQRAQKDRAGNKYAVMTFLT